jgi:hypothetical protein
LNEIDEGSLIIISVNLNEILPIVFSLFKYLKLNKRFKEEFDQIFCFWKKTRRRNSSRVWWNIKRFLSLRIKKDSVVIRKQSNNDRKLSNYDCNDLTINRSKSICSKKVELAINQLKSETVV